jgi:hypothetical protein
MKGVSSFYMTQFEQITTAMKEAGIPYKIEEFMTVGNTAAFNLFVDAENLEIATKLCMQVERYRQY